MKNTRTVVDATAISRLADCFSLDQKQVQLLTQLAELFHNGTSPDFSKKLKSFDDPAVSRALAAYTKANSPYDDSEYDDNLTPIREL